MEPTILKLKSQIDSLVSYLKPLLPLANSHMNDFITDNHWDNYLPQSLRDYLHNFQLDDILKDFWETDLSDNKGADNELKKWIRNCRQHHVAANNEYCLTKQQLEDKISVWGHAVKQEIQVSSFMTSKKSYEVQFMSNLVATVSSVSKCTHCVEVGGGRSPLPAALALAYHQPVLSIDCNDAVVATAQKRFRILQKQWHAIAKRLNSVKQGEHKTETQNNEEAALSRFAAAFVSNETDLLNMVKENFPEHADRHVKLLLTGLHTCGNLGPDSLRMFARMPYIGAVFNTPCCYHHLTEADGLDLDFFQMKYGCERDSYYGFPMSEHLSGFHLGRNARMLAAQSIDRVVRHREMPARSLLYRAMLEVVIQENTKKLRVRSTHIKTKGLGDKCQNFDDYFKMADSIFKLDIYDNLPESYHAGIQKMCCQWDKVVVYYLVRLCLAQVIESLILLDRLMFLFENEFDKAYLVKLFDPVMSPRCHSIVAIRS